MSNLLWNVLTCLAELYNCLNANTATRVDFTKYRPYKTSPLISLQSAFNLSASVDMIAPFLKENQQLHDADDA